MLHDVRLRNKLTTVTMNILLLLCICFIAFGCDPKNNRSDLIRVEEGQSIQDAIDGADPGDTIVIADGIYHERINVTKALYIKAEHPGEVCITNKYPGRQFWEPSEKNDSTWFMEGIDWPVLWLLVDGLHAFDFRTKENFDKQVCGPYWSKGWQEGKQYYPNPPIYFAKDSLSGKLWLKLDDERDPNTLQVDFNSRYLDDTTYIQKDLGAYWNQQQIVRVSKDPSEYPVTMWYGGTPDNPSQPRYMYIPKICGIVIDIESDNVTLEGLRIHLAPTVGVEVNNSRHVNILDCYFSGYQYGINTGYECTNLRVENCEFDGGKLVSFGNHSNVNLIMWHHSTYMVPVRFNGTGLSFKHNYVYEGYDLFQPRGRHKYFSHIPDLMSEVAFNVWQQAIDNNLEFDGVEALISMRFHHNLVLGRGSNDMLAITTTENGDPLLIDHNLFWNGGDKGKIMKLIGTRRINDGIKFIHNTYYTGGGCPGSVALFGKNSIFENNIIISSCNKEGCWTEEALGGFFPTKYNICPDADDFIIGFNGINADPKLGNNPHNKFCLQPGSPAIDAAIVKEGYHNEKYTGTAPDLGALEATEDINSWRKEFGHCGPSWINSENASVKAPNRPDWPKELDKRWGGLTE